MAVEEKERHKFVEMGKTVSKECQKWFWMMNASFESHQVVLDIKFTPTRR
jgi:hypothetical protein